MRRYILDTNIISYLSDTSPQADIISQKLSSLSPSDTIHISIITLYEMVYGAHSAQSSEQKSSLQHATRFIENHLDIIPLDTKEAHIFADLKARYKHHTGITKNALKRHNLDLMIAATALATDATLVSNDSIFRSLMEIEPTFHCENWLH